MGTAIEVIESTQCGQVIDIVMSHIFSPNFDLDTRKAHEIVPRLSISPCLPLSRFLILLAQGILSVKFTYNRDNREQ